ncbi:transcriptional regulator [Rhizobium sp. SIMBA_035]
MNVFLDFEASSLSKHSYPIEIAWVFEDGQSRSLLIAPPANWTDWSADAERLHGISREKLADEGVPISLVVQEMMATLSDHDLFASSPSWDGKWLSVLLRAGGVPRHALRVRKSDHLFVEVALMLIEDRDVRGVDAAALVANVIARSEPAGPAHRALPDAALELERLRLVREAIESLATALAQPRHDC